MTTAENNMVRLAKKVVGLFSIFKVPCLPQKSEERKNRHRKEAVKEVSREAALRMGCYTTEKDLDRIRKELCSL